MKDRPERRTHDPHDAHGQLSESVADAVSAHDAATLSADEFALYDHVDPDALDALFGDTPPVDVTLQLELPNVTVSVWNDDGVDVRVTEQRA